MGLFLLIMKLQSIAKYKNNMKNRLSLIPIFLGTSQAAHSNPTNRIRDLLKTILSIQEHFTVIVSVCSEDDRKTLEKSGISSRIVKCEPIFLPSSTAEWARNELTGFDTVLLTEADQVFYTTDGWDQLDEVINDDSYLSPHRLERTYYEAGRNRGQLVKIDGIEYVSPNGHDTNTSKKWCKYSDMAKAFGGAYYCNWNFFKKIKISYSEGLPIEHGTGFDIFRTGDCLKTSNILDFYVDHLSGYEYHQKLAGIDGYTLA